MILGEPTIDTCGRQGKPPRQGAGCRGGVLVNTPGVGGGRARTLAGGSRFEP